jgi:hypothetical protein
LTSSNEVLSPRGSSRRGMSECDSLAMWC